MEPVSCYGFKIQMIHDLEKMTHKLLNIAAFVLLPLDNHPCLETCNGNITGRFYSNSTV